MNLFKHMKITQSELALVKGELANKIDELKVLGAKFEKAEKQAGVTGQEKKPDAFALVLVDGDCIQFQDGLVKDGLEGGKQAAALLKKAVEADPLWSDFPQYKIMVRVYANMHGLGQAYKDMELLSQAELLGEFVRGFNMGDPMFDCVDAGNDGKCSQEKVMAHLKLHVADTHCQRVYFGGSADYAYADLLGTHFKDEKARGRICPIEGPHYIQEVEGIKHKFTIATFGDVFREERLHALQSSQSLTNPPTAFLVGPANGNMKPPPKPPVLPAQGRKPLDSAKGSRMFEVIYNKYGQRVDSKLVYSESRFERLRNQRLCRDYHLFGDCLKKSEDCDFQHGKKLCLEEREALLALTRCMPCNRSLACRDPACSYGHNCNKPKCQGGRGCRFPLEAHGVDTSVLYG